MSQLLAYGDKLIGTIQPSTYHQFSVPTTAWGSNTDSSTSTRYPYKATITSDLFTDNSHPTWQMNGVSSLPTNTEATEIEKVADAIFTSTGIILYATDEPSVALVLQVGGEAGNSESQPANDITYNNTNSGLEATDVQGAIDELAEKQTDIISGTLTAGSTTITLSNQRIKTTSIIDTYVWVSDNTTTDIIAPTQVSVTNGSCTLTFDAQSANVLVGIRVS